MIADFSYLIVAILFIIGIKRMTKVKTAASGNMLAALAMLLAVIITLLKMDSIGWGFIVSGVILGALIGTILARAVKMTAMPQLVAIFNGLGGAASMIVALAVLFLHKNGVVIETVTILLSIIIGAVTFSGSIIAFGKLQGIIKRNSLPGNNIIKIILSLAVIGLSVLILNLLPFPSLSLYVAVMVLALILGIFLVISIGGADMPVVIALLNSYSGIAAASTGFVLNNTVLIISGALVGASGLILTSIMCKAMNRSLLSVLFGGLGTESAPKEQGEYKDVKECSAEEATLLFEGAQKVIIIPGYGLAVAQAQHAIKNLTTLLEKRKVDVSFAIHPVAGRMPGHMNVLLAEADIEYEKLKDLDHINHEFKKADIAIVVGANDVVNPAAAQDKSSPLYGMPILNAYEAKTVIVIKRGLGSGFSGVKNDLFERDNTLMLYGDAKEVILHLVQEVESL